MKQCRVCGLKKPSEEYYKRKDSKDGLRADCKSCTDRKTSTYAKTHVSLSNEIKKRWAKNNSEKRRATWRKIYPELYRRDRHKINARQMVARSLRKGIITREGCVKCGDKKVEAHHEDYSKPLEIIWLCNTHHRETDNRRRGKEIRDYLYGF